MNKTFSALAEPNRLHIVELLRDGPLTVGEIADRHVGREIRSLGRLFAANIREGKEKTI